MGNITDRFLFTGIYKQLTLTQKSLISKKDFIKKNGKVKLCIIKKSE